MKFPPAHLKYLLETNFKKNIIEFKIEWMTLPGSSWDSQALHGTPKKAITNGHCPVPLGVVGAWVGAGGRLVKVVTACGCSQGPDRPQGFLTLQVLKEAHFVFYGGSPYRPPVSVDKHPCKFTQDF